MISTSKPSEVDRERLARLAEALRSYRQRVRYVDYGRAEQDCELLAAKIRERFTASDLDRSVFSAIPRGGLIVLGMLAYLLDLRPAQLRAEREPDGTLFVVDDCALTGARFASHLSHTEARQVVFSPLYSHPALRQTICEQESRVSACISAHDLADLAGMPGNGLEAWRQRWSERLGGKRYWIGPTELVCFAWSEPDHPFWNPATGRVEDVWRWLPPHLCLKTRGRLAGPSGAATPRQWQAPEHVVSGELDGALWLCDTRTEHIYSFSGVGADIWRLLACWGHPSPVTEKLTEMYDVHAEVARGDVARFAAELEAMGLLERISGSPEEAAEAPR
jgi:hypothetical protein